jgi:hypothetical protein
MYTIGQINTAFLIELVPSRFWRRKLIKKITLLIGEATPNEPTRPAQEKNSPSPSVDSPPTKRMPPGKTFDYFGFVLLLMTFNLLFDPKKISCTMIYMVSTMYHGLARLSSKKLKNNSVLLVPTKKNIPAARVQRAWGYV